MFKRRLGIVLSGGLLLGGLVSFHSIEADGNPPPPVRSRAARSESGNSFMRAKLNATHQIVDGLAFEDFSRIEQAANDLMSIGESASWKVNRNPVYMQYAADFENTARQLRDAGRARNIEKATFAYMHLTVSCAACHRHVRNVIQIAPQQDARFVPVPRGRVIR